MVVSHFPVWFVLPSAAALILHGMGDDVCDLAYCCPGAVDCSSYFPTTVSRGNTGAERADLDPTRPAAYLEPDGAAVDKWRGSAEDVPTERNRDRNSRNGWRLCVEAVTRMFLAAQLLSVRLGGMDQVEVIPRSNLCQT